MIRRTGKKAWKFEDKETAFTKWTEAYGWRLRRRLMPVRFRPRTAIDQATADLTTRTIEVPWAFTGGKAADLLTGHYKAVDLTVVAACDADEFARPVGWMRDPEGPITVLRAPTDAFAAHRMIDNRFPTTHPLLTYAELTWTGGGREREVAEMIRKDHLQ
jgi:hypothetical protein